MQAAGRRHAFLQELHAGREVVDRACAVRAKEHCRELRLRQCARSVEIAAGDASRRAAHRAVSVRLPAGAAGLAPARVRAPRAVQAQGDRAMCPRRSRRILSRWLPYRRCSISTRSAYRRCAAPMGVANPAVALVGFGGLDDEESVSNQRIDRIARCAARTSSKAIHLEDGMACKMVISSMLTTTSRSQVRRERHPFEKRAQSASAGRQRAQIEHELFSRFEQYDGAAA